MKDVIIAILCAFIMTLSIIYSWYKISDRKADFNNYKLYISIFSITFVSTLNFFIINKYFRIMLITAVLIVFYIYLFRGDIKRGILTPIYCQFLTILSEGIYTIILICLMGGNMDKIISILEIIVLTNILVSLILCILVHLKPVRSLYYFTCKLVNSIKYIYLVLSCFMLMLIANILVMTSYYKIEFTYFFLFNTFMIVICMLIVVYSFKTHDNYNKVSDQYNVAKTSLQDYENMMTKYRVANHENKNLLLTVRAMSINNEKNIPEYIDSIIENKYEDDEKLLFEMGVIPTGGLRATIYSEILKIKENKIDYNLNIDRKISTIDLIELDTNTTIDICKILGVFIDNSIDATRKLKKKVINIDMYIIDEKLYIKVSNNFSGAIDISRIYEEGYTTKSKGHGYGLPLVKEIINSNNYLENETEINRKVFSQILKIRYKKNH